MSDYLPPGWTPDKIEESLEFQRRQKENQSPPKDCDHDFICLKGMGYECPHFREGMCRKEPKVK